MNFQDNNLAILLSQNVLKNEFKVFAEDNPNLDSIEELNDIIEKNKLLGGIKMKKYIELSIYAEGYYSGASYKETVFLIKELWDKIKGDFKTTFYIDELDGKYSEVETELDINEYTEEELKKYRVKYDDSGDILYLEVFYALKNIIQEKEDGEIEDLLINLKKEVDSYNQQISINLSVKKEDLKDLNNFLYEKGYKTILL